MLVVEGVRKRTGIIRHQRVPRDEDAAIAGEGFKA